MKTNRILTTVLVLTTTLCLPSFEAKAAPPVLSPPSLGPGGLTLSWTGGGAQNVLEQRATLSDAWADGLWVFVLQTNGSSVTVPMPNSQLAPVSGQGTFQEPWLAPVQSQTAYHRVREIDTCAPPPPSPTVVNPKDPPYNATGDGVTDDTAALQAAINAVAGTGGTLLVPAGTYMIDASVSLSLGNNMTLSLAPGADLKAIPNDLIGYNIIVLSGLTNVNIVGGVIEGDRASHLDVLGGSGAGIEVANSQDVVVDGVTVKEMWGDGMQVIGNSTNVTVCNVVSDHNRRVGLLVHTVDGLVVKNSVFKNGQDGTLGLGISLSEDTSTYIRNVSVQNCLFQTNIDGFTSGGDQAVTNIVVTQCLFQDCNDSAVSAGAAAAIVCRDNRMEGTGNGFYINASGCLIEHNQIVGTAPGQDQNGIWIDGGSANIVTNNTILNKGRHGITVGGNALTNIISHNLIAGNSQLEPNGGRNNITINSAATGTVITDNTCRKGDNPYDPQEGVHVGVRINAGAVSTVLTNNDLLNAGYSANVVDLGTGSVISGNTGYP